MLWLSAGLTLGTTVGCPRTSQRPATTQQAKTPPKPLVVLVADDPPLAEAIAREWRGRTEEELTVTQVKIDDLKKANRLPGDAVIFPNGELGQLAERGLLLPLENEALEDAEFNYRDIFDQVRLREMRWGGRTVAAPLGSPQLLLCYRADLFQEYNLAIPGDWKGYQQLVEQLVHLKSAVAMTAVEPLAEGWAGQMLLARAAGYVMHRDQVSPLFRLGTAEPLIGEAPFVRALEELVDATKLMGSKDAERMTPAAAFEALLSGKCGAAIAWPAAGMTEDAVRQPEANGRKLAFAPLPTSRQAYRFATSSWESREVEDTAPIPLLSISGRMAAVTTSTQDARRASGLVIWLAGRGVSERVSSQSSATTVFRQSHVTQSSRWTPQLTADESRKYAETLSETLGSTRAMPGLTIPGRTDYLAALDQAVYGALEGKPAAETLAAAAKRWQEITEKLSSESQRKAIAHSLGQTQGIGR